MTGPPSVETGQAGGNRLIVALVAACGALALVLAIVGVYGIVAYAVVRRTREIGVRIALGASRAQILGLLVREGGAVAATGVVVGVLAALGSTRLLASMLYGISATDAATFLSVAIAVDGAAILASSVPAARAAYQPDRGAAARVNRPLGLSPVQASFRRMKHFR
jgi:putative ABC transport system permease protein